MATGRRVNKVSMDTVIVGALELKLQLHANLQTTEPFINPTFGTYQAGLPGRFWPSLGATTGPPTLLWSRRHPGRPPH